MHILWIFLLTLFTSVAIANESLWEKLRNDPNMVVLMRNSESIGNRDGSNMLIWDASGKCEGESTLTDAGKVQARRIGVAFSEHGIKPKVISSPICRCTETARIAFGDYVTDPDLRQRSLEDTDGEDIFQTKSSSILSKYRGKTPAKLGEAT